MSPGVDSRYLTLLGKGRRKWRPSVRTSARVLLKWLKKSTLSQKKNFVKQVFAYLWHFFFSLAISLPFWQPLQNSGTCIPKGSCKKRLNYGENTRVYLLNLAYLDRHRPFIANRAETWPRHYESVSYKNVTYFLLFQNNPEIWPNSDYNRSRVDRISM